MQKDTAPSQPPTVHQHQKPSWPTQQMAILGGKSTAKFDENTVTRVKCPSSLLRGNQQEGPNYSPSQGGGVGGKTRERIYPARTSQLHISWEIQKFGFPIFAATYRL